MTDEFQVLSVGHSSLKIEEFVSLLSSAEVTAIADVRSSPYSRRMPHFSQGPLRNTLKGADVAYVFLGDVLGGRPKDQHLYTRGIADYELMAETEDFGRGLERVIEGAKRYRIALMCSERNPLDCHRFLLVSRHLAERGASVGHVVAQNQIVRHVDLEQRLLIEENRAEPDMVASSPEERLALAYRERSQRVAYAEQDGNRARALGAG